MAHRASQPPPRNQIKTLSVDTVLPVSCHLKTLSGTVLIDSEYRVKLAADLSPLTHSECFQMKEPARCINRKCQRWTACQGCCQEAALQQRVRGPLLVSISSLGSWNNAPLSPCSLIRCKCSWYHNFCSSNLQRRHESALKNNLSQKDRSKPILVVEEGGCDGGGGYRPPWQWNIWGSRMCTFSFCAD